MSCGAMNSCVDRNVFRGIDLCYEGISELCKGLHSVAENNVRNGIEQIQNGICVFTQGLTTIQTASNQTNCCNSLIRRQIRKCHQQLCNIRLGRRDIMQNNVKMGSDDIRLAACSLEQILEEINNFFEESNQTCNCDDC